MSYFEPVKYVVASNDMLWLTVGLVAGMISMAIIDFVIDRSKK